MAGGEQILDTRGYRCPVPVIRLEAVLRSLRAGEKVTVLADDPVSTVDIPHFCREAGHRVERREVNGADCVFQVTCGGKPT